MTNSGYSLNRPTLKANYIKILQTIASFNDVDAYPTRSQVREITGITHDQGFDKAINALIDDGTIEEREGGKLWTNNHDILYLAAERSARHYGIW